MQTQSKLRPLIIVGNGFDLYHGISSSYLQFKDYLLKNHDDLHDVLERYLHLDAEEEWNHLETNLAYLDADDLLEEMKIFIGDYSGEWKDSMYYDFQYEVDRVTSKLGTEMLRVFRDWIMQLDISHLSNTSKLQLPKNAWYLNFNYTDSLEKLYGIDPNNILYIHGKANISNSSVILGHAWDNHTEATIKEPPTYEDFVDGNYATEEDWQWTEAVQSIQYYFATTYKNSAEIIEANIDFFEKFREVNEVYVMGHSMSPVDESYFSFVAKSIPAQKVKWIISYYKKEDVDNCKKTLQKIGVELDTVEFKRLADFFSPQLPLIID